VTLFRDQLSIMAKIGRLWHGDINTICIPLTKHGLLG